MSFYHKYELVKLIHNQETKTFQAREISSGKTVWLHMLSGLDEIRQQEFVARVKAYRAEAGASEILDLDDEPGSPYLVTEILQPFTNITEWVRVKTRHVKVPAVVVSAGRSVPKAAPAAPPAPPQPAPPASPPGEFTRMFGGGAAPAEPAGPAAPPAAPLPPAQPGRPMARPGPTAGYPPQTPPPGEFTRMFGGAGGPAEPAAPAAPAAPAQPASPMAPPGSTAGHPPQTPPPGEFTRMFGGGSGASPASPPLEPAKAPGPFTSSFGQAPPAGQQPSGEFTRLFGSAPPPAPTPALPATGGPARQDPQAPEAGEFTRFFNLPAEANPVPIEEIERGVIAPPPPPPSAKPFRPPSEFTKQFGPAQPAEEGNWKPPQPPQGYSGAEATGIFATPVARAAAPPAPSADEDPSEFSQMFKMPQTAAEPAAPPVAPAPAPVAAASRSVPLWATIALSALFVLCLAMAAYIALKR